MTWLLKPQWVPTRRTVLAVRCLLALGALVLSCFETSLSGVLIGGYLLWRWKEEWKQPAGPQHQRERAGFYAATLKKGGTLMALCAAVSLVCFVTASVKGADSQTNFNALAGLIVAAYWLFDRANFLIWAACYVVIIALVVTIFGPFELKLR